MKKLNLIIGKKQIMIAALLVTLSTAAVLNFYYAAGDQSVSVYDDLKQDKDKDKDNKGIQKYGQTQLVYNNKDNDNNFQIKKINKQADYDRKRDELNNLLDNKNLSKKEKNKIIEELSKNANNASQSTAIEEQTKLTLEGTVKDCLTYINGEENKANIYVQANGELQDKDALKIQNIAMKTTNFLPQNIEITQTR